jgi:hypothetical protein
VQDSLAASRIDCNHCAYRGKIYTVTLSKLHLAAGAMVTVSIKSGEPYAMLANMTAVQSSKVAN